MDTGNNYKHHVVEAYEEIVRMQNLDEWNMGSLTFTTDSLNALQAADVIAWSARRRMIQAFPVGFEPLEGIFDDDHYGHLMDEKSLSEISASLRAKMKP
jgi:hypothetical protein